MGLHLATVSRDSLIVRKSRRVSQESYYCSCLELDESGCTRVWFSSEHGRLALFSWRVRAWSGLRVVSVFNLHSSKFS